MPVSRYSNVPLLSVLVKSGNEFLSFHFYINQRLYIDALCERINSISWHYMIINQLLMFQLSPKIDLYSSAKMRFHILNISQMTLVYKSTTTYFLYKD